MWFYSIEKLNLGSKEPRGRRAITKGNKAIERSIR